MLKKALLVLGLFALVLSVGAISAHAEPKFGLLGAPFNTWGEFNQRLSGDDITTPGTSLGNVSIRGRGRELQSFETRLEQGLTIAQFGPQDRFTLVPFVALRFNLRHYEVAGSLAIDDQKYTGTIDRLDVALKQEFGLKVNYRVDGTGALNGGLLSVGIRGVNTNHVVDALSGTNLDRNGLRGEVFATYWFGGDWVRK